MTCGWENCPLCMLELVLEPSGLSHRRINICRMVVKEDSAIKEMKLHVYSELLGKEKNCETHFLPFSPGLRASLVAQLVKSLPVIREIWVRSLGRSPGEGKGYPLQYSGLENSMDCIVHGIAKSRTRLNDFHFHFPGLISP